MNHTIENPGLEIVQYSTCSRVRAIYQKTPDFASTSSWVSSSINIPLSLTAFLGNLVIVIALRKAKSINGPTKLLFLNLAFTDLFVGLVAQPLFCFHLMSIAQERWDLCQFTEKSGYIPTVTLCAVSLLTVTAISVDRLLVLLKGLRYRKVVTLTRVRILLIIMWSSSLCTGVSFLWNVRVFFGITCISIVFCVVVSTTSYAKIFLTLRCEKKKVQDGCHNRQPNQIPPLFAVKRYRQSVSAALWIHLTLIACYMPYATVKVATTFGVVTPTLLIVEAFMATLVYLNSTLNPVLYCWRIKEVRYRVKDRSCNI